MNNQLYTRLSLELHLFFDRIMKEHSIFLEAGFLEKDRNLKEIANNYQKQFSTILNEIVNISNGNISRDFLASEEMITKNTKEAEEKTSLLTGIEINTTITNKELRLNSGNININPNLLNRISMINKKTIILLSNFIKYKEEVLNRVLNCNLYTSNYPLLINHITNEAKMYYKLLRKVENKEVFTETYIYEQELFWNDIMKEHAMFIRGGLDPSENDLIMTANNFVNDYKKIEEEYSSNNNILLNTSLGETLKLRDFKIAGEEGILDCKIKSIILPLLADHVVREANHFIRILRSARSINNM